MKKVIISKLFLILLASLCSLDLSASVGRLCKIKYKTEQGWSEEKIYEVEFCAGSELNTRTNSHNYRYNKSYALLWFSTDQVAILETSGFGSMIFSDNFSAKDFRDLFSIEREKTCYQVNDGGKREWVLKGKESINFIDPRANEDD